MQLTNAQIGNWIRWKVFWAICDVMLASVCAIGPRRFMELDDVFHIRRCISVQCVMKERERVDCALVGHTIFNRAFLLRSRITEKKNSFTL